MDNPWKHNGNPWTGGQIVPTGPDYTEKLFAQSNADGWCTDVQGWPDSTKSWGEWA
jgi:hypothetical protein